eukprot:TRINITY_DN12751_c0_g1_i1.p1 TRINITY_DN12751_c0_g1~~TRINITY_DN12751_c0_g1_i1.p1  ORF type:complete len:213 (+),score=89.35 TRINITY_DN12751_c0_g1_i1:159-797(+)
MGLFDTYVQEVGELRESVRQSIAALEACSDSSQRAAEYRRAQGLLEEAEETIQAMRLQANATERPKVSEYEKELATWKSDIDDAKYSSEHKSLLGGASGMEMLDVTSDDHRARLAHSTQKINRGSTYIQQAQEIAEDTLDLGVNSMAELKRQEEVMEGGIRKVGGMNERLSEAQRVMRQISRTLVQNKLMLIGIIMLLLLAMGIIIYLKFLW